MVFLAQAHIVAHGFRLGQAGQRQVVTQQTIEIGGIDGNIGEIDAGAAVIVFLEDQLFGLQQAFAAK